jgi:hypothetical protein
MGVVAPSIVTSAEGLICGTDIFYGHLSQLWVIKEAFEQMFEK